MSKKDKIFEEIVRTNIKLSLLQKEYEDACSNQLFKCGHCNKSSKLSNWSWMNKYWWDYCEDYNVSDEISLICPKCKWLNRCLDNKWKEYDFNVSNYKEFIKEYHRYSDYTWYLGPERTPIKQPYIHFVNI